MGSTITITVDQNHNYLVSNLLKLVAQCYGANVLIDVMAKCTKCSDSRVISKNKYISSLDPQ